MDSIKLSRSIYVSVAHRYWNGLWTPNKNLQVYGSEAGERGSNLRLEVEALVQVTADEKVLLPALQVLKGLVDHQSLIGEAPSTLEVISLWLGDRLLKMPLSNGTWSSLCVAESDDLWCRVQPAANEVELSFKFGSLTVTIKAPIDPASGLAIDRACVRQAVERLAVRRQKQVAASELTEWSMELFHQLKDEVKPLRSFRVDLDRHEFIVMESEP